MGSLLSKKRVAVSTWCSDDYREYIGIDELTNSIKYFHPEITHYVTTGKEDIGDIWMMAPTCLDVADDYDMVIHVDGDAVVVGDLSEMISSDADVIGTLNNNVLGHAGAHAGITTELMKYDEENNIYTPHGTTIPINAWLNAGVIAANKKQFWQSWHDLNASINEQLKSYNWKRLPAPFGDENDTLNVVFHSGKFSTYIVDALENNIHYNISNAWGKDSNNHWESWKELYMKGDKVFLNDPISGVPKQVKVLHQAGGSLGNKLNKQHGGFRNWLRQAVSQEVSEFIGHVSK